MSTYIFSFAITYILFGVH